eukprot:c8908_g1_i1 orf=284-463(+)
MICIHKGACSTQLFFCLRTVLNSVSACNVDPERDSFERHVKVWMLSQVINITRRQIWLP